MAELAGASIDVKRVDPEQNRILAGSGT